MWTLHCGACVTFCRRGEHDSAAGIAVSILHRKKIFKLFNPQATNYDPTPPL